MTEKGRTAAPGLGMFGGAGIVALCAAGAITAFLVLVFSFFLPEWAATLIVGAALAAVAFVLIKQGKERSPRLASPSGRDNRDGEGGRGMGEADLEARDDADSRDQLETLRNPRERWREKAEEAQRS